MKTINDLDYVGMRDYDVVSKKDMKNLSEEVAKDYLIKNGIKYEVKIIKEVDEK